MEHMADIKVLLGTFFVSCFPSCSTTSKGVLCFSASIYRLQMSLSS